jgi:molybdenum cofactor cytidylyltransferase
MVGILLAAGFSRRFGPANKLLHRLPDGCAVALAAARSLIQAVPLSTAVVRPENIELAELLQGAGLKVMFCTDQEQQLADSLSAVVRFSAGTSESNGGFIIALADMPYIDPLTITAVATRLSAGASIVVPTYQGQRGHPVGFSAKFRYDLESLHGDEGARSILKRYPNEIHMLECDDAGILADIDTPADLMR